MSKEVFNRYDSAAYLEAAAEVGGDDPAFMAWPRPGQKHSEA
jgi:hypothetical protein